MTPEPCPHYTEQVHPDYCVFCREDELRAEIEKLKAEIATLRELREYDRKEIQLLRARERGW